jgi:hypothetical protein
MTKDAFSKSQRKAIVAEQKRGRWQALSWLSNGFAGGFVLRIEARGRQCLLRGAKEAYEAWSLAFFFSKESEDLHYFVSVSHTTQLNMKKNGRP